MNTRPMFRKRIPLLLALAALGAGNAIAQDKPATDPKPAPGTKTDNASLEARLDAARERLEAAAAEVGQLSAQLGESVAHRFMFSEPRRSIIGVQLDPASGKDGVRVREVSPGGPAAEAGVRAGDVIVAINGTEVTGREGKGEAAREVVSLVREMEPESKVKLRVMRDGKPKDIEVTARPMARRYFDFRTAPGFDPPDPPDPPDPADPAFPAMPFDFMQGWRGGLSGMELATLTPGLGSYFGVDKGVLVLRAPSDDRYKLKDGDVILSIDGREPTSGTHATRILRSYQPGEKLTLRIMRDRKAQNVEVALPERQQRRERRQAARDEREA
jgi:C-terminal processing protease CtpA/Prc